MIINISDSSRINEENLKIKRRIKIEYTCRQRAKTSKEIETPTNTQIDMIGQKKCCMSRK